MKRMSAWLLFSVCLVVGVQARCARLPDACGNGKIEFDVKTQKHQAPPAAPAPGKAQIVFFEDENQMVAPFSYATVRFGMDGAWVGADYGNSYFAIDIEPGVHHLCASWQGLMGRNQVDLAPLTAEPGKVYYFSAKVSVESKSSVAFCMSQLNDDQSKYRLEVSRRSTSNVRRDDEQ